MKKKMKKMLSLSLAFLVFCTGFCPAGTYQALGAESSGETLESFSESISESESAAGSSKSESESAAGSSESESESAAGSSESESESTADSSESELESVMETETEENCEKEGNDETESSEAEGKLTIIGFENFDPYSDEPYDTRFIYNDDGERSYLLLPAKVTALVQGEDGDPYYDEINACWTCEDWEDPLKDCYTFTFEADTDIYCYGGELEEAITSGAGHLPEIFVDVIWEGISLYHYVTNIYMPTKITVSSQLIAIPGTTTTTYDFTVNGVRGFCMEHPIPSAAMGATVTPLIYTNTNIQKAFYYGYGGVKPYPHFTSEAQAIVLTSLALSYFYMGDGYFAPTWQGGAYGSYSYSIGFAQFLDYIKSQPYESGIANMSFDKTALNAYVDGNVQRTEEVTFTYAQGEYITMDIPDGVTLVNVTRGTESTKSGTIYGGDRFYLKAPLSMRGVWNSNKMTGSKGRYAPILCITGSSTQDIGYGEWVEDKDHTVSLSVKWISGRSAEVIKRDVLTGQALSGARLRLEDAQGNVLARWISMNSAYKTASLEIGQTYRIIEEEAPMGYLITDPVAFTIIEGEGSQIVFVDNVPTQYTFQKTDQNTGLRIAGAALRLSEKNGAVVDQWQSDTGGYIVTHLQPGKAYVLTELTPPAGYASTAEIEFMVSRESGPQTVTMTDDYTKTEILKVDKTTKAPVEGAKLQLKDDTGKVLDTWVTGKTPHRIDKLVVGKTYTVEEIQAPAGYVTAPPMTFTVKDSGNVQKYEMEDDYTKTEIIKVDKDTGKAVPGARLAVYGTDADGKADTKKCFDTWTSTEFAHRINYLPVGKYILRELKAPGEAGYVTSEDVSFEVKDSGTIVAVEMQDRHTWLEVLKTDAVTGDPVAGAKLAIYKVGSDGKVEAQSSYEWVSDSKPHKIEYIPTGKYVLRELEAPYKDGYVTSKDIEFEIKDTPLKQEVHMKDELTKIHIAKIDSETKEMVSGASLVLKDKDGKVVAEWISTDQPYEITGLHPGETYILEEIAPPKGYYSGEKVEVIIKDTPAVQAFEMADDQTEIDFAKKDEKGDFLEGAHMKLTTAKGEVIDEWISTKDVHIVKKLVVGEKYVLTETAPPDGYATAKPIEFVVEDRKSEKKKESQAVVMDNNPTQIFVEKLCSNTKARLKGAELKICNEDGEVIETWISSDEGYIIKKLTVGETYTVREVKAPKNYALAENVTFTVRDTVKLQKVAMYDDLISVKTLAAPQTGDFRPTAAMAAMAGISLLCGGYAGIRLYMKRRKYKK